MTGYECVAQSIELFESSLESKDRTKKIHTVRTLAARAGYSVHHFSRLFSAVTALSPKEYIQGRTLSVLAERIVATDVPLSALAEEAGYADYETFSRSFHARFGVTPKWLRETGHIPFERVDRFVPGARAPSAASAPAAPLAIDAPETVREDAITIAGMSFFMEEGEESFARPWEIFMKAAPSVRGAVTPERYYQFSSWLANDSLPGISIVCALEVADPAAQSPVFATRKIPAATYLKFTHTGGNGTLADTYRFIYGEWLANNDVRPAATWEFQRYVGGITEIYIPLSVTEQEL
jgi:AraC family transcriptional regulator